MNVDLPNTGCNIISSSSSFYNYHSDGRTRDTYIIYENQAILQNTSTSQYGYTYSGDCLTTGDLVYKPELQVYFQFFSVILCGLIAVLLWKTIGRLIGR